MTMDASDLDKLTRREREVLSAVAQGKKAKEIAHESGRSIPTVHDLMKKARHRLGALTLPHAVAIATKEGLV